MTATLMISDERPITFLASSRARRYLLRNGRRVYVRRYYGHDMELLEDEAE